MEPKARGGGVRLKWVWGGSQNDRLFKLSVSHNDCRSTAAHASSQEPVRQIWRGNFKYWGSWCGHLSDQENSDHHHPPRTGPSAEGCNVKNPHLASISAHYGGGLNSTSQMPVCGRGAWPQAPHETAPDGQTGRTIESINDIMQLPLTKVTT